MVNTKNVVITALVVAGIVLGVVVIRSIGNISSGLQSIAQSLSSAASYRLGGNTTYGGSLTVEDLETTANAITGTTGALTVAGATSITGTTTPTQLLFPVGGTVTITATGTPANVYTNTTGPKMCYRSTAGWRMKGNGSFAPSLVGSIGTSTGATTASTNLIASSTVATSTDAGGSTIDMVKLADNPLGAFVLGNNVSITSIIGDITNTEASSTNLTKWASEFRMLCSESAI